MSAKAFWARSFQPEFDTALALGTLTDSLVLAEDLWLWGRTFETAVLSRAGVDPRSAEAKTHFGRGAPTKMIFKQAVPAKTAPSEAFPVPANFSWKMAAVATLEAATTKMVKLARVLSGGWPQAASKTGAPTGAETREAVHPTGRRRAATKRPPANTPSEVREEKRISKKSAARTAELKAACETCSGILAGEGKAAAELFAAPWGEEVQELIGHAGRVVFQAADFLDGTREGIEADHFLSLVPAALEKLKAVARRDTKDAKRKWAQASLKNGAKKAHQFTNAENTRIAEGNASAIGPQEAANLAALPWRQEWQADNAEGILEAFQKTMEHREKAVASIEAAEEAQEMLADTAEKFRQAAKTFKPSTARRLDGFSFKDFAVIQGEPAEELANITRRCVCSLALPAQELRHGGALLPKKDGGKMMIAIIGVFTANLVRMLAVPLRKWDREIACEGDSAAPGRQAMLR